MHHWFILVISGFTTPIYAPSLSRAFELRLQQPPRGVAAGVPVGMLRHIDMNSAGPLAVSPADTAQHAALQKEACIALIQALMNAALDRPPGDAATGFSQRMGQAAVNVLLKRDTRPREVGRTPSLPPGPASFAGRIWACLPGNACAFIHRCTACRIHPRCRRVSASTLRMQLHSMPRWQACEWRGARLATIYPIV